MSKKALKKKTKNYKFNTDSRFFLLFDEKDLKDFKIFLKGKRYRQHCQDIYAWTPDGSVLKIFPTIVEIVYNGCDDDGRSYQSLNQIDPFEILQVFADYIKKNEIETFRLLSKNKRERELAKLFLKFKDKI